MVTFDVAAFFTYFFTINYPEILQTYYFPKQMLVRDAVIAPRYCCTLQCGFCENATSAPSCKVMLNQAQQLDPRQCSQSNITQCPLSGQEAVCDDGYECCSQCCQTCQSCSMSCAGSGSSRICTNICTPYVCNCYCCLSTDHKKCEMMCDQCYSVTLEVMFNDNEGNVQNASYREDFSKDLKRATTFFHEKLPGVTFTGYYKPGDPSKIILSRDFTAWKWGVFAIFALLIFKDLVWGTMTLLHTFLEATTSWMVCFVVWLGVIWPFVILLPIQRVGYISPTGRMSLVVIIPLLAVIGWSPASLHRLQANGWSTRAAGTCHIAGTGVPFAVLLPLTIFYPHLAWPLAPLLILVSGYLFVLLVPLDNLRRCTSKGPPPPYSLEG